MFEGFLAVISKPSRHLPIDHFHDWYEGEHIPLRLNHLKEFLSGARYTACSLRAGQPSRDLGKEDESDNTSSSESWLALYTLTSSAVFSSGTYTALRINRSEREKDVMSRIEELMRFAGDVIEVWCDDELRTTGFMPGRPSEWVVTHGLGVKGQDEVAGSTIASWVSHLREKFWGAKEESGWTRARLVKVLERSLSRFGVNAELDTNMSMPYYVVHEFTERAVAEAYIKLIHDFPYPNIDLGERKFWKLYKAYPCLSQENRPSSSECISA